MEKKDFILDASMKMLLEIIREWDTGDEELVDIAKDCAIAAEKIWDNQSESPPPVGSFCLLLHYFCPHNN